MKVRENVTIYTCDHCNKRLIIKYAMIRHELHCHMNPLNYPACIGCDNLEEQQKVIEENVSDYYSGTRSVKTFYCKKLNRYLYPQKVIRLGLLEKYPEQFEGEERMPTECEYKTKEHYLSPIGKI